jgi:hypothetical protein
MARSPNRHADGQLEPDTVAATLATDPEAAPEDTVILIGIPASSRADKFKLFRDLRITRAVEGPREAIRASKDIPGGQVPLGLKCVALWVAADAPLTHTYAGRGARASSLVAIIDRDVLCPLTPSCGLQRYFSERGRSANLPTPNYRAWLQARSSISNGILGARDCPCQR